MPENNNGEGGLLSLEPVLILCPPPTGRQTFQTGRPRTVFVRFPFVLPFCRVVKRAIAFSAVFMQNNPMTFKRITCDPKRMNGQPCVRQLRLTVRRVVEAVATYPDRRDLQREFPELEPEDIREALAYAAANLDDKVIELATLG